MNATPHSTRKSKQATKANLGHLFGESTRKTGLDADWNAVEPFVLHKAIWAINELGGAITFSTTKSGSAYVFKVYIGAPYSPVYFDGDEEGRAAMTAWVDDLVAVVAENV